MSGKKINNKEHNMTNPYDFDKLEYEKGYKGCAKSGSGIPIVNKLFGRRLCDLGIGTKEYENNRNKDWLNEGLNGGPKLPENQPEPTSNAEPTPNNETNKKETGDTGTSGDNNTGNGNDGGNSNGENTGNSGNKPGGTGNTGVGENTGSEGSGNTGSSEDNGGSNT